MHTTRVGESGPWVVFCHGLFGQGRNWTGVAKALSEEYRCLLLDLPDHGRSPWSEEVSYVEMAEAVAESVGAAVDGPVRLVGHSMGGKVAMLLALRRPELVERLCVVDMSPTDYGGAVSGGFSQYVGAMRAVDLGGLQRRSQAQEQLSAGVPDETVRGFLLQNLRQDRDTGVWSWQMNLRSLGDHLDVLAGWPADVVAGKTYDGPVLWVAGSDSDYIRPEYQQEMATLFPHVRKVVVKGAGHWVHSEQPEVFVEVLRRFLRD